MTQMPSIETMQSILFYKQKNPSMYRTGIHQTDDLRKLGNEVAMSIKFHNYFRWIIMNEHAKEFDNFNKIYVKARSKPC